MPTPSPRARLAVALAVGALFGYYRWWLWTFRALSNDFGPAWFGARAIVRGLDPYALVGPGLAYPSQWPLVYPMPALLAALPLAPFGEHAAAILMVAIGTGALAYVLTRERWGPVLGMLGTSVLTSMHNAQWAPLLTGAALVPGAGWLLAAKPTIGLALFAAYPTRRTAIGCAAVVALSLLIDPTWPAHWWANTHALTHQVVGLTVLPVGPLMLLALAKWRRPEARLLLALSCVPLTLTAYDTTPLLLVPAGWLSALALAVLSHVAWAGVGFHVPPGTPMFSRASAVASAGAMLAWVYLPCLLLVLRRPNVGTVPAWAERAAAALPLRRAARMASDAG